MHEGPGGLPSPGLSPLLTPASRLHLAHVSDSFLRLTLSFTIKYQLNLDSILKSRDITLLANVHRVKAMVFPVVMNGCENWTIRNAELQRTNAFKLWCWRGFLIVPYTVVSNSLQPHELQEVGGASRDPTGLGALEEGLISS